MSGFDARGFRAAGAVGRGLLNSQRLFAGSGLSGRALFAVSMTGLGSSIYFSLGVVAGEALGLTPLAFLIAGAFFVVTLMTYLEVSSLHVERGGASMFARYAFNELWSFVAGWAIVLDYLIVMAIAAFSVSHYLAAFWSSAGRAGFELVIAAAVLAYVAFSNVRGLSSDRLVSALRIVLLNLALGAAGTLVGLWLLYDPALILDSIDIGVAPRVSDLLFACVIASLAFTGIEATSGLAGDVRVNRQGLRRFLVATGAVGILVFLGISVVALVAVPVRAGATELGGRYLEAPVLGIVSAYEPQWLRESFRYAVGGIASLALVQAVNVNMLGLSRLAYSLAVNRQIPYTLGRLHARNSTPWIVIVIGALLAFLLAATSSLRFLAGIFAFGAMLTFTIAHVSLIVLRFREPGRRPGYRVPLSIPVGRGSIPIPAAIGALASFAAWISVLVLQTGALIVGGVWMVGGIVLYVLYRRSQDESLTERYTVPAQALQGERDVEYGSILVPIFGGPLDDDIVGTAGRLAAEEGDEGEAATIDALYVIEMPMALPLDARLPDDRVAEARRALARAKEVGEEYDGVEVYTAMVRSRSPGATIVDEARRRGVEAIVLAADEPAQRGGGGLLGGRGALRGRALGEMTKHVVEKAPCRVILTAPAPEDTPRERPAPRARLAR